MNNKKEIIKLWSILLVGTTILNILLLIILFVFELYELAIISVFTISWNIIALVIWILSFNIQDKKLNIENNEIEIYAGFANHYIKVNGELKDEYKSGLSFVPIKLSCLINDKKLEVTISTSNHIVVKLDDELVK